MTHLKRILVTLATCLTMAALSPALAQSGPSLPGDWHGMLETPQGRLTIILTVTQDEAGGLAAELESPDQAPGRKIPVTSISAEDGQLSFRIAAIGASYEGTWAAEDAVWKGTFNQGIDLALDLARGLPNAKPVIEGMDGVWEGGFERNGVTLRLVLRITTGDRGTIVALDSPDQMAMGLAVRNFSREGSTIHFELPVGEQVYEGQLSEDESRITGIWSSSMLPDTEVVFTRTRDTAERREPNRPQTPTDIPYPTEEVTVDNPEAEGVTLAGTLSLPKGTGPFPAAVLISGSGPQDRDETLLGHKPFAVIADHLARNGIAVLRYDDRGTAESTGNHNEATSADLATDANAAARYLAGRPEIRKDAIGFIGHSEGGMIGPIAMAENDDIDFLVMLAGPGTDTIQLLRSQRRLIGATQGMTDEELDRADGVMTAIFLAIASADTPEAGQEAVRALMTPEARTRLGLPPDADAELVVRQFSSPWFHYFLGYDPAPNLGKIDVPVLALGGSLDRQVPSDENLPAIEAALVNSPDVTVVELAGLNHLFQEAETGAVGEYADIEQTFAPAALDRISGWINARFGPQ